MHISYNPTEELKRRKRRYSIRTHLRRWDSSMWRRTHLECSVSPLSGSMTSLRILSRKSANLSGLQRWTSSPITCKQSCGLRASSQGRAIMLMPIRIRIPSFTHVGKQNFTFYFYTQQCQLTLFYLSHHRHHRPHNFQYFSTWKISEKRIV